MRYYVFVAVIFLIAGCEGRGHRRPTPSKNGNGHTSKRPTKQPKRTSPESRESRGNSIEFNVYIHPVEGRYDDVMPLKKESDKGIKISMGSKAIDKMINSVKREMHIPGYQFCGPGTKTDERIARGERGVNKLDAACLIHDLAYKSRDLYDRHEADKVLLAAAQARTDAKDADKMEKLASWFVVECMEIKISGSIFEFEAFMERMKKLFSDMKGTYFDRRMKENFSPDYTY